MVPSASPTMAGVFPPMSTPPRVNLPSKPFSLYFMPAVNLAVVVIKCREGYTESGFPSLMLFLHGSMSPSGAIIRYISNATKGVSPSQNWSAVPVKRKKRELGLISCQIPKFLAKVSNLITVPSPDVYEN